ncbi:unnamed protein product [Mytilus coruscus]|uniref:Uncharacterized protein n=1 Tax=Mytilus coruscus TaxID=42192 RepID=A0A6J8DZN5_MYTCO|nr:unnamed protein product [Mytilus coruscus]
MEKEFLYVDCSSLEMKDIPRLPSNVKTLNLSNNKIQYIKDYSFDNLANLTDLDLTGNKLQTERIGQYAFEGLNQLQRLTLANNDISVVHLPKGIFQPLLSLLYLNIKHNAINKNIQGKIICDLHALETLEVDIMNTYSSGFNLFGKGVSLLRRLKRLVSGLCGVFLLTK